MRQIAIALVLFFVACDDTNNTDASAGMDMTATPDLASAPDLVAAADLVSTGGDMGMGSDGSVSDGGQNACTQMCIANNPTAYQKFTGYSLKECGCAAGSPCATDCTAECADPTKLNASSACGMCLGNEGSKGTASACTLKAATSDCLPDPACAAFVSCALGC